MALRGVGAEHDDGNVAGGRVGAQAAQDLVTGYVGQVQVEQDQVKVVFAGQIQGDSGEHGRDAG